MDAGSPEKAPPEIVELVTAAFAAQDQATPAAGSEHAMRETERPPPARFGRAVYASGVSTAPTALIMAAGQGTRMRSSVPKVLHEVCGRPMVAWPILAAREAGRRPGLRDRLAR